MRKILILLIVMLSAYAVTIAQKVPANDTVPIFYYGAYAGYNSNIHTPDFGELPGYPCCCLKYQDGSGSGFAIGGLLEYPFNQAILLSLRLGYSGYSGVLDRIETKECLDINDNLRDADLKYTLDASLHSIGLEPTVTFRFFDNFYSHIGVRFAYLFTGDFTQTSTVEKPDYIKFADNDPNFVDYKDPIPDLNAMQMFGVLGLGYALPIGKDSYIVPEIMYYTPFTDISSVDWNVAAIQFGLSLEFPVYPAKDKENIEETIYLRDTTVIYDKTIDEQILTLKSTIETVDTEETEEFIRNETRISESYELRLPSESMINVGLEVNGINHEGLRVDVPQIVIEETETEEGFPLLPHVFFPAGSSELSRTDMHLLSPNEASSFAEDKLPWSTMGIYSEMLNVIGHRLKNKPAARITITGCNNETGEGENLALSEKRARELKDYLAQTWGINAGRIQVKSRGLPANPGKNTILDGQIENARAEISSSDFDILKPVMLSEIVVTSNPPIVEILPSINADSEVKSWKLSISQSGALIKDFSGEGVPAAINWTVAEGTVPRLEENVLITFEATDEYGKTARVNTEIEIQQLTIRKKRYELKDDKRIERFSLIVFDFNSDRVTAQHRRVLNDIKQRITPTSLVTISGYADRTGELEYNRDLAERRCNSTQEVLKVPSVRLTLNPVGSSRLLFNNDIPQGRAYSRTVQIVIETPTTE